MSKKRHCDHCDKILISGLTFRIDRVGTIGGYTLQPPLSLLEIAVGLVLDFCDPRCAGRWINDEAIMVMRGEQG